MGLFVYTQKGSIISMVDLPTTETIEPFLLLDLCFRFSNFGVKDKKVHWTFVFAFQILGSKIKRSTGPFYLSGVRIIGIMIGSRSVFSYRNGRRALTIAPLTVWILASLLRMAIRMASNKIRWLSRIRSPDSRI